MTGAPAPAGADAVVMVEHTSRHDSRVQIDKGSKRRRQHRSDRRPKPSAESACCLPGLRLDYAAIAVAASTEETACWFTASPKSPCLPRVTKLWTLTSLPDANQIRNSNSYSLAAQVQAAGGEPVLLPIAPDEPARLRELIADGLEADLLLLAGGVSMGKYDLVEHVLAEFQAEFFFTGVLIQPGKPAGFWARPERPGTNRQRIGSSSPRPDLFLRPARKSRLHHGDV